MKKPNTLRRAVSAASLALLLALAAAPVAQAGKTLTAIAAERAQAADGFGLKGDVPGWLFLRDDATHLSKGEFWKGEPTPALPIITKFRETLSAAGVTLILAPVPSKAVIYPDKFLAGMAPGAAVSPAPFLEQLKATGAEVIDLDALFRAGRQKGGAEVFCATDSHWSPAGVEVAARAIAAHPALTALAKPGAYVTSAPEKLAIAGDLTAAPGLEGTPKEELTLTRTGSGAVSAPVPVPAAADGSPVILMGDSHTMVFGDGASLGMHCQGAGLRDKLQGLLGFPLIQLSNQNSGGTGARRLFNQRLLANPGYLKNVKAVVWVFSIREFTTGRWR